MHDGASSLNTAFLHLGHSPLNSSLHISNSFPQQGHFTYSGFGCMIFTAPGHFKYFSLFYINLQKFPVS
jgi:hypothetical protein